MKTILITGAAGNLGSLTAEYLLENSQCNLKLMYHRKPIKEKLRKTPRVSISQADLGDTSTLYSAVQSVDTIIHFAGVLFKSNPEKFLPITNSQFFKNLLSAAKTANVKRIILISFPHVEGQTSNIYPSTDKIDRYPISIHAQTRLEEEMMLRSEFENSIILRAGMVYGRGILMPDAARWFAKRYMLGVWTTPTYIHLISKDDFCEALKNACFNESASGTYNIGDDGHQTLQEYLDFSCKVWGCKRPWRMPLWMIYFAASVFEQISRITGLKSPLTKDFIDIGRVSYYGDTTRMKQDLLPNLKYKTMYDAKDII